MLPPSDACILNKNSVAEIRKKIHTYSQGRNFRCIAQNPKPASIGVLEGGARPLYAARIGEEQSMALDAWAPAAFDRLRHEVQGRSVALAMHLTRLGHGGSQGRDRVC